MLEGGCGMGQYVICYTIKGVKVVGLDFAQKALHRLNNRVPNLLLCAGDVSSLPFMDESFDVYYSGGVVEHFEAGATRALVEANRVLKKDSIFLVSVPYFSPLRSILLPFKKNEWKFTNKEQVDTTESTNGLRFFQYAYKTREFEKMLNNTGFKVIEKQGYAIIWGLSELPFFRSINEIKLPQRNNPMKELRKLKFLISNN